MANNRLFLVHGPSGLGVMLGKRLGWGWKDAASVDELQALFDKVAEGGYEGHQDDFRLIFESDLQPARGDPTVDGLRKFVRLF